MTATPALDTTIEDAPPTARLSAVDLARALAAMDLCADEEQEQEPRSAEGNRMNCASAFRPDPALRPSTDDEPTLDVPAPPIPPGVPSPLGDDLPLPDSANGFRKPDETLTLHELGLDLDDEFPFLASSGEVTRPNEELPLEAPDALRVRRSVVASWMLAAAISALCTYLVTTAQSSNVDEPRRGPETAATVDAHPNP